MSDEMNIKFIGNRIEREEALKYVDGVIRKADGFGDVAGFSKGLDALSHDYRIQISDDDDSYSIRMESLTGNFDRLDFVIDKFSGNVYRPDGTKKFKKGGEDDVDFLDEL